MPVTADLPSNRPRLRDRAARCCKRAVIEPCALSLRDNGQKRNARAGRVSPCGTWREGQASGQRTYTQKQYALQPREGFTRRRGLAMRDTAGGGHVIERWVMRRSYEGGSERRRVAYSTA